MLSGEGTPANVRVYPQPSGARDVDRAAACVSSQTSASRDDDATCVSPRPSGSRKVDPTSAHPDPPRGGVHEKGISLSASRRQGFRRKPRPFDLVKVERSLGEKADSPPSVEERHGVIIAGIGHPLRRMKNWLVYPQRGEITADLPATGLPATLLPRWKLPARSGVYNPSPSR